MAKIVHPHQRSFEIAPTVAADEVVTFIHADKEEPGWFFGRTADGIEGYFPEAWFEIEGAQAVARRPYDAMELTVAVGMQVTVLETVAGWRRVETADGRVGWIRAACVTLD